VSKTAVDVLLGQAFPSEEVMACPYPYYDAVRQRAPVSKPAGGDHFVVTRYEDVVFVAEHPELFSNHHSVFENGFMRASTLDDLETDRPWAIATSDPPAHTAKRKIAFEMFKPGRLREHEAAIAEIVDGLIDTFIGRGRVEFVSEFAALIPARVILLILGLPQDDVARMVTWSKWDAFGARFASPERQTEGAESFVEVGDYVREAILERYERPRGDDLTVFVRGHVEAAGKLDLPNIVADATTLIFGGMTNTAAMIANAMMLLVSEPELMGRVRADNALLGRVLEEALRIESPAQQSPRLCLRDTEVGGVTIPAGSSVLLVWGSANRDEAQFDHADRFDPERENVRRQVAFGHGRHSCIGAPLARLEGRIAFERLFARIEDFRFSEGKNDFANRPSAQNRVPRELYLDFGTAAPV
jgi:cytochrome P450